MSKKQDIKNAADGLDKFFSSSQPEEKPVKAAEKKEKPVKKVFSFRTEAELADDWRLYADAAGMKVDELGTEALTEYIKKHPLKADQHQIYELKKAQKKS